MTRSLCLLVSSGCNLDCSYCYQRRHSQRRAMDWSVARAAVEMLLRRSDGDCELSFSGGEPLLAPDLVRRTVRFVESVRARDASIEYTLTTNGTLLDDAMLGFLVEHDFGLQISFDGVCAAQDRRGRSSFDILDRLLDRIQTGYPDFWEDRVVVGVTLSVATIPYFAESMEYFIGKGNAHIEVQPVVTWQQWDAAAERELDQQVEQILSVSERHWRSTRKVPVGFLRPSKAPDPSLERPPVACGACVGKGLTVDAEGRAWGCQLFASSIQDLPPLGDSVAEALDVGDIRDPSFDGRLAALPRKGLGQSVLWSLDKKSPSHGRCCECRHVASCHICPASTIHIPDNHDPLRVADFPCAFSRITLDAENEFARRTAADRFLDALKGIGESVRLMNEALPATK